MTNYLKRKAILRELNPATTLGTRQNHFFRVGDHYVMLTPVGLARVCQPGIAIGDVDSRSLVWCFEHVGAAT